MQNFVNRLLRATVRQSISLIGILSLTLLICRGDDLIILYADYRHDLFSIPLAFLWFLE
jgi:hypothetical protein